MATVRAMDESTRTCPWCSTPIEPDTHVCPRCAAQLSGPVAADIPGLTSIDPEARNRPAPEPGAGPLAWLNGSRPPQFAHKEAFEAPSDAVRHEMRKMELEAQLLNAGTEVLNPVGDSSLEVGAPSDEAIVAYESGLLDEKGPAGEDLGEVARSWERPEQAK
jgi:hypothetical protein